MSATKLNMLVTKVRRILAKNCNLSHASCGFTCNGISYVCDSNCAVFEFDWKKDKIKWDKYATASVYLSDEKILSGQISMYVYQRKA